MPSRKVDPLVFPDFRLSDGTLGINQSLEYCTAMQNRSLWIIVGILGAGVAALILLVLTLGWLVSIESSPASAQPSGNGKTQSVPGTLAGSPDAPVSQQDYLTGAFEAYADKDKTRLAMASKHAEKKRFSRRHNLRWS